MESARREDIIHSFKNFAGDTLFPCLAARSVLAEDHLRIFVAAHMACPFEDASILSFLYKFIDELRMNDGELYSAVVIFAQPESLTEDEYENYFWSRMQSLANLDARYHNYDQRVSSDVHSPQFSFSIREEAFYVIGMHPGSSRAARRFQYPAMIFNAHSLFEKLRRDGHYSKMQKVVRKRDTVYSGSVNPMLADFGEKPEVFQYTGKQYDADWQCPLKINHAGHHDHSTP